MTVPFRSQYVDTCAATPLTVSANATTLAPDLTLSKSGAIAGVVTDAAGHRFKVAKVVVFTATQPARFAAIAVTNGRGRYRATGLSSGRYLVCYFAPGRSGQCYRQVRWNLKSDPSRLPGITKVRVTSGQPPPRASTPCCTGTRASG